MGFFFIKLKDAIIETFNSLINNANSEVDEFASYIEVTYIWAKRRRGPDESPKFPLKMWNVYNLVLNNTYRTNIVVEGFHSKLGELLATHHANI